MSFLPSFLRMPASKQRDGWEHVEAEAGRMAVSLRSEGKEAYQNVVR